MKRAHRRQFLCLTAGSIALPFFSRAASALDYPTRPVRIVVGFPPGGGQDLIARLVAQQLSERLKQPFIVENKPGAATNLAIESVVNSAPDGHSLVIIGPPAAINATLYKDLRFNFLRDIAPVASFVSQPLVMVVNPSFPAKSIPEFIAHAKANPGKLNLAANGQGGGPHMAGELFKVAAGVNMVTVQYRGDAPALTDLMGGQVQLYFASYTGAIELIRGGKLRALGVTSTMAAEALPDVPPVSDAVPGYEVNAVFGVGTPKATPVEIVDKLNATINEIIADPKMRMRLADIGGTVLALSPARYRELIVAETEKWAKVIHAANIKAE
jgi:tripartite-type tricarboxylate transporter receptor subunit TctC